MPASLSRCDRFTAPGSIAAVHADGRVEVEFDLGRCAGCRGACTWRRAMTESIQLRAAGPFAVGDPVRLSLPARRVLAGAWGLHGLPLIALLVGAGCGAAVLGGDAGTLLGAVGGVAAALVAAPRVARRAEIAAFAEATVERREEGAR